MTLVNVDFKEQNCRAVFQFLCGRFLRMEAGGQCLHQTNQGIAERCFLFPQKTGYLSLSCRQSAKTSHKQTERAQQFIASPRLKLGEHFCHSCTGPSGAHYSQGNLLTPANTKKYKESFTNCANCYMFEITAKTKQVSSVSPK